MSQVRRVDVMTSTQVVSFPALSRSQTHCNWGILRTSETTAAMAEEVIVRVEEPGSPGTSRAALQPKQTSVDREQGSTSSLTRTSSLGSRIRR